MKLCKVRHAAQSASQAHCCATANARFPAQVARHKPSATRPQMRIRSESSPLATELHTRIGRRPDEKPGSSSFWYFFCNCSPRSDEIGGSPLKRPPLERLAVGRQSQKDSESGHCSRLGYLAPPTDSCGRLQQQREFAQKGKGNNDAEIHL